MPRLFRNGKWLVALAMLLVPGAAADPSALLGAPLLDGDEPPLGDGIPPGVIETAPLLDDSWESLLVRRLVNLTWDYAHSVDPADNATEAQRKATQYLDAIQYEAKAVRLPDPLDLVCVQFTPDVGNEPGPHREQYQYASLPITLGKWTVDILNTSRDCVVP